MSHLLLVLILGVVMSGASITFFGITRSIDQVLQGNFKTMQAAHEMTTALHAEETAFAMLESEDPMEAHSVYTNAAASFNRGLAAASELATTNAERNLLKKVSTDSAQTHAEAMALFNSPSTSIRQKAQTLFQQKLRPELNDTRTLTESLLTNGRIAIVENNDAAMADARAAFWRSVGITVSATAAAIVIALAMVRRILTPLNELTKHAEKVAQGDLSPNAIKVRQDEVGALAASFNDMVAKVAEARQLDAKTIRRLERISETALESMYDPLIVTDADQRIIRINKAAEVIFGAVPEEPRKPVAEHISDSRILKAIERAVHSEQISAGEDESSQVHLTVNGERKTYRLRATPMKGTQDRVVGSVTVLEDITHLKVVDQMKSEFIGVASHDLRSPVTSLILANHLLKDGAAGPLTPDQAEILQTQATDLERLERLMRDLLDSSKLEAGAALPKLEPVQVAELAKHPVENLRIQADKKEVKLSMEIPNSLPTVMADPLQIGRVLTNLIGNAIRHTHPGGSVTVRALEGPNVVTLSVEDTGEGIPEEYRKRIFDRFVQVPGVPQGGAGLGLSIAQKIVQEHGGEMSVESVIGKGSIFRFSIPTVQPLSGEGVNV